MEAGGIDADVAAGERISRWSASDAASSLAAMAITAALSFTVWRLSLLRQSSMCALRLDGVAAVPARLSQAPLTQRTQREHVLYLTVHEQYIHSTAL